MVRSRQRIGRLTSADSIVPHPGDPQSYDRYAYVRNRLLSAVDPSGHQDTPVDLGTIHIGGDIRYVYTYIQTYAAYAAALSNAGYYGASILPGLPGFAVGDQLQYRQFLSVLRVYGPQLQATGFFMTRQPNLTPPPEPAPASTIAAGYAISSNAFGYAAGWVINNHRMAATILGQALDFCGVFCDAGAIISVSSGLGPYGRAPGQAVGAVARGLRSFANFGATERAAAVAAESATGAFSASAQVDGALGIFAERQAHRDAKGS